MSNTSDGWPEVTALKEKIRDLERELAEEKEKNRLLEERIAKLEAQHGVVNL